MKRMSLAVALLILLGPTILSAQERKMVDPIDLVNLKSVSDPQISPDGSSIAYVIMTPGSAGEPANTDIWLVSADGSASARPFVLSSGSDTSPRWSPDGISLAFLSDRMNLLAKDPVFHFSVVGADDRKDITLQNKEIGVPEHEAKRADQIWILPLRGGEATPLTDIPGGVKSFTWSKDGKLIAFIRTDLDTKQDVERKNRKEDQIEVDKNYKFDRLWVVDVAIQQARLITKADMNIDDIDWSPDGGRVLARVSPTPRIDDYWRVSKIVVINASTGTVEKTLLERASCIPPSWSPDAQSAAFAGLGPKNTLSGAPVLVNLTSGKEIVIGSSYVGTISGMEWDQDGKTLTAAAIEGTIPVFLKVDALSGSVTKLSGIRGPGETFTMSRDGQTIAYLSQTMEQPDEVCVRSRGEERVLTNTNPQVKNWSLGVSEELSWKNTKDGMTVRGILILPANYEKGNRYPTIVSVHGGPEEAWISGFHGSWYDWGLVLASHGYAVLLPNPRGSMGAGPAFTAANYRDWGGGDFQDIMDGVDSLISRGIADPGRLGIGGWSYGGFMTAWAVTHTDRFKAAVVGAAVTDLFTMATTTDIAPKYLSYYFGELGPNHKLYDAHSPVRFLDRCHTPTLVMHGEADVRVPISQGEEFFNGLRFLGRETQMVRYPREPHIFIEKEHQRDSLERMLRWYDAHLRQ